MEEAQIVVEYRPILQVCQFYVKSRFYHQDTKIEVEENKITIITDSLYLEIFMPESVKLLKESLSGLNFSDVSLIFRIQTIPERNKGSFKTEMYLREEKKIKIDVFKPNLENDKAVNIYCRFCFTQLTKNEIIFSRILPLPENFDTNEFFCHKHDDHDFNLDPKFNDLLYGSYYFNIHSSIINTHGRNVDDEHETVITCNNCLNWLGNCKKTYFQLWNSTTFVGDKPPDSFVDLSVIDFTNLIKNLSNDIFSSNNKIIMECDLGKNEIVFLLLWIMDKKLTLLTSNDDLFLGKVKLNDKTVMKLLYSFQSTKTKVVDKWLSFTNTVTVKVSKNMLENGRNHLEKMSSHIPEEYRKAHDMNISYLDI